VTRRRRVDGGILAARLHGSAIRLVHSGATEVDAVRELVELAAGRAHLLTEEAALWRRSATDPLSANGPAAATTAAHLLDAAAETTRHGE
jgi:hypothetical protein